MDVFTAISGIGGVGAIILGCSILLYKCCRGRRIHTKSGCISIDLSNDVHPHPEQETKDEG